jgi:hypothetical protein
MKTFTQKEIRKYEKKARVAERKFGETNDDEYLRKRDKYNDKVEELKRNAVINEKDKVKKVNDQCKSDNQLLNEAIRQNRREKNERMKEAQENDEKQRVLSERRSEIKKMLREKNNQTQKMIDDQIEKNKEIEESEKEFKENFLKDYFEKYPKRNQSEAQKDFVKEYKRMIEHMTFKNNVIQHFIQQGMSVEEAQSQFNHLIKASIQENEMKLPGGPQALLEDVTEQVHVDEAHRIVVEE